MPAFDWSQYLVLAKELSTRTDEAALRSAISRAYYAAYHHAKSFCASKGIVITKSGANSDHFDLWDTFGKKAGTTFSNIHTRGDRLKRKRHNADYDNGIPALAVVVADSIKDADAIFYLLKI